LTEKKQKFLKSPNEPAEPRIPVSPITTKSDPRSPFYDTQNEEIAPLARLVLKRKRIVPGQCRPIEEYRREAQNISSSTSEDAEYKDRSEFGDFSEQKIPKISLKILYNLDFYFPKSF